jgi:hypothetical protein
MYVVNKNTASPATHATGIAKLKFTEETKDTNLF